MEAVMGGTNMAGGYTGNLPSGASGISSNPVLATTEPKGALNHFCQRYCRRPVTKEDIVYTSAKYGKVYQATVTLNCIEGQQFVGEVAPVLKDAEKNAAQQALIYFEPCVDTLPPLVGSKNKKRKAPPASSVAVGLPDATGDEPAAKRAMLASSMPPSILGENPALTPKVSLNTICMKLLKRPMRKGEVLYETHNTARGFQSTVRLPCLPGEMGELAWAGEVASQQKQAEQNAAAQALEAVNEKLDFLQSAIPSQPRKDNSNAKGWGKGSWGKGKNSWYGKGSGCGGYGWGGWSGYGPSSGGYHGGYGPGCGGLYNSIYDDSYDAYEGGCEGYEGYGGDMDGGAVGMGVGCGTGCMGGGMSRMDNMSGMDSMGSMGDGGKGSKGAKAGREEASPERRPQPPSSVPRNRITKVAITGEVIEWRGRYGWLKSHAEIQHAAAKKHGGKLFISRSDFADPNLRLEEGTVLQFHVYEDPNGLGAEEVQAF